MKVLLVDDNTLTRDSLAELLRQDGLTVETAGNGAVALSKMSEGFTPDVVLSDLVMPGLGGAEFVAQLRSRSEWEGIPVVILTAAGEDVINGVGNLPGVKVVRKPLDPVFIKTILHSTAGGVGC